ncbi:MAG: acyl-ACP--UDP-N-acetylglucosamine O-acyltransferase [Chthoniobacteraceae bacterium]
MSATIHPTAIIHPSAEIGAGCEIGPYCVVGAGVVLGEECWLQSHVVLDGPSLIGPRNRFFAFGSIGQRTQDLKYAGEPTHLEIGEANTFREFVTVNRGTLPGAKTTIGSRGNFLAYCHIAHDCTVGNDVIFSNNGTLAGHVEVGDHVVLGGLTAVHQFCRLGAHAMTGGCSKIVQDVPPYLIADGNPAAVRGINKVGLERHGFTEEQLRVVKECYRTLYRKNLNVGQAVEQIRESFGDSPVVEAFVNFVGNSPRGIIK